MYLLCFVEEPSAEAALSLLLPRLLPGVEFQLLLFQGKADLLKKLPARLRAYADWMPIDWRILVLVDEDRQDCLSLKSQLEQAAFSAGLLSKSQAAGGSFQLLNRIAVEELEAWFLGDAPALRQAYPRLPADFERGRRWRDPDAVNGGTWEALEQLLQQHGYYDTGYAKVEAARKIAGYMQPEHNRSHSFQVFVQGLRAL